MIGVPRSTGTIPGVDTLSSMQDKVLSWLTANPDDENRRAATAAINLAIDRLNTRVWRKVLKYQDIPLTSGQADYYVNRDFKDSRVSLFLDSDGNPTSPSNWHGFLHQREFDLLTQASAIGTGSPRFYTVYYTQRILSLDVLPSSDFVTSYPTLRIRYYPRIPHLTAPSDAITIVPPEFSSFCVHYGRYELAISRGRANVADSAERAWRETERNLIAWDGEIHEDF